MERKYLRWESGPGIECLLGVQYQLREREGVRRLELLVMKVQRKAAAARWVEVFALHLFWGVWLVGSLVLAFRLLHWPGGEWLSCLLALCPLSAYLRSRRSPLSPVGACAWLDLQSGGDGRLLAAYEEGGDGWEISVENALQGLSPRLRLRFWKPFFSLLPGLLFWSLAALLPIPPATDSPSGLLVEEKQVIQRAASVLREAALVEPPGLEALLESIDQLDLASSGLDEQLEAVDRLRGQIQDRSAAMEQAAGQAAANVDRPGSTAFQEALRQLEEQGMVSREQAAGLREEILPAGLQETLREQLNGQLSKLSESGLSKLDNEGLSKLFQQQGDEGSQASGPGGGKESGSGKDSQGQTPGSGEGTGPSERPGGTGPDGGGSEPLTWGPARTGAMDRSQPSMLPGSDPSGSAHFVTIGRGTSPPIADPRADIAGGDASASVGTGVSAWEVPPQKREAVRSFFSEPQ
jgi:hypothetical protein